MLRRLLAFAGSAAIHLALGAALLSLAPGAVQGVNAGGQIDAMSVFVVPATPETSLPGLKPIDVTEIDAAIGRPDRALALSFPGFRFDLRKIADRADLLFPFLTPGLSLEHFALEPRREVSDSYRDPFAPAAVAARSLRPLPPLALSEAAAQAIIDKAWSRRDRWNLFQRVAQLTGVYSPTSGKLPGLLKLYREQDGLQPYVDSTMHDPRLWAELGLAADHVDFIGFISRYASEHPSTRAATELLLLLDRLAEASLDALVTMLDNDPYKDLLWTRDVNGPAFDLMLQIRHHYDAVLARRGLDSPEKLRNYYDKVRLEILTGILRTTPDGYRAGDARFLIGAIYWREGRAAEALREWRDIAVDPDDTYAMACRQLLDAITGDRTGRALTLKINDALRAEHGRWFMFSIDRLRQFGYHVDTF